MSLDESEAPLLNVTRSNPFNRHEGVWLQRGNNVSNTNGDTPLVNDSDTFDIASVSSHVSDNSNFRRPRGGSGFSSDILDVSDNPQDWQVQDLEPGKVH